MATLRGRKTNLKERKTDLEMEAPVLVKKQEILDFLEYLKTPLDIADPKEWKPEEIEVLKKYQSLAPELFADLKADNCLNFSDVFPVQLPEAMARVNREDNRLARFTQITSNITNSLAKSKKIFGAEEQWFIFLSLYLSECERIKSLFLDSIRKINKKLPPKKRQRLKGFITLGPLITILRNYKKGKYAYLFSEIDVELRNGVAHFSYEFLNDKIQYGDNKTISTLALLFKYRKISALLAILFGNKTKAFAKEFEQLAKKMGVID